MKTKDLRREDGSLSGFEVSNTLVSRRGIGRIVRTVPEVELLRCAPTFPFFGDDVFCEFRLRGITFVVWEPYGDSDCYMVIAREPCMDADLASVRAAFAAANPLFYLF